MTNEEKITIVAMRLDGYSFQAIADKLGVSKQYIHQILNTICGSRKENGRYDYVYPNIAKWFIDNDASVFDFALVVGVKQNRLTDRLKGRIPFKIDEIKKVLDFTGMTFEEAFYEKSESAEESTL